MKLANIADSKSAALKSLWVQVPPVAQSLVNIIKLWNMTKDNAESSRTDEEHSGTESIENAIPDQKIPDGAKEMAEEVTREFFTEKQLDDERDRIFKKIKILKEIRSKSLSARQKIITFYDDGSAATIRDWERYLHGIEARIRLIHGLPDSISNAKEIEKLTRLKNWEE